MLESKDFYSWCIFLDGSFFKSFGDGTEARENAYKEASKLWKEKAYKKECAITRTHVIVNNF